MKRAMKQKKRKIAETTARGQGSAPAERPQPLELPILGEESWLALIDPAFHDRPEVAETFAHRLFALKEAIESGSEGAIRAVEAINEGIRLTYQYTNIHQAALRLFHLYLAGELPMQPQALLEAAIERAYAREEATGARNEH